MSRRQRQQQVPFPFEAVQPRDIEGWIQINGLSGCADLSLQQGECQRCRSPTDGEGTDEDASLHRGKALYCTALAHISEAIRALQDTLAPADDRSRWVESLQGVWRQVASLPAADQSLCSRNVEPLGFPTAGCSTDAVGKIDIDDLEDAVSETSGSSASVPAEVRDYFDSKQELQILQERVSELRDAIDERMSGQAELDVAQPSLLHDEERLRYLQEALAKKSEHAAQQLAVCVDMGLNPQDHRYRRYSSESA